MAEHYLKEVLVISVWIALAIQISYLLWKPAWLWDDIARWLSEETE